MTHRSDSELGFETGRTAPQPTHLEIPMESALSPREIQARIRAGDSVDDVARAAGMAVDWVEPFAAPVIAEREYVAQLAQNHQVRRGGETIPHRNLGQVVSDRLMSRRVNTDSLVWDAWRLEGRRWLVCLDYDSGKAHHEARFVYDVNGRFSVADNDDARWLVGLQSASHGPQPGRRRHEDDAEPTVDLNDDIALVRVVQPRANELAPRERLVPDADGEVDDAYAEAELAEVDGVYDILPSQTGGLDVLYDMLSSFDEDSVQIYAGLIREDLRERPPAPQPPASTTTTAKAAEPRAPRPKAAELKAAKPAARPAPGRTVVAPTPVTEAAPPAEPIAAAPADGPQPSLEDATEDLPTERPRTRRKRAEVPSWDEIMFGAPKNRS
jgi:hypothetical protein